MGECGAGARGVAATVASQCRFDITLIVTDVSPLITLAAAGTLDYLLYPGLPVIIPDAVFYEATRQTDRMGADVERAVIAWPKGTDELP